MKLFRRLQPLFLGVEHLSAVGWLPAGLRRVIASGLTARTEHWDRVFTAMSPFLPKNVAAPRW